MILAAPDASFEGDVAALVAEARDRRPDLKAAEARVKAEQSGVDYARAAGLPTVPLQRWPAMGGPRRRLGCGIIVSSASPASDGEHLRSPTARSPTARSRRHLQPRGLLRNARQRSLTVVVTQQARSIIARNDSPEVPFAQSINPYQGCEQRCVDRYARPSHAYLNLSPGIDFETRIFAKAYAADLLRAELAARNYRCSLIAPAAAQRERVQNAIREMSGGRDNDPCFGSRMTGNGPIADLIARRFALASRRLVFDEERVELRTDLFGPPRPGWQLELF